MNSICKCDINIIQIHPLICRSYGFILFLRKGLKTCRFFNIILFKRQEIMNSFLDPVNLENSTFMLGECLIKISAYYKESSKTYNVFLRTNIQISVRKLCFQKHKKK